MNENERKQLEALGFELDTGDFWHREETIVISGLPAQLRFTVQEENAHPRNWRECWSLTLDLVDTEGEPVELVALRFPGLALLTAALESGEPPVAPSRHAEQQHGDPRRFSLQVEGASGAPAAVDLDGFLADNELAPEEVAQIQALQPGESVNLGGGAAPIFTLKREA